MLANKDTQAEYDAMADEFGLAHGTKYCRLVDLTGAGFGTKTCTDGYAVATQNQK